MADFQYNASEYLRQAQRYIIPLYKKDELGHYNFSSTGTFVMYNGQYFLIGALHALDKRDENIENLYYFDTGSGNYNQIIHEATGFKKFDKKYDIFIIDFFNRKWDSKNYFNLNKSNHDLNNFVPNAFYWLGFPQTWQDVKKKKKNFNPAEMLDKYVHHSDDTTYSSANKFFAYPSFCTESDKENFLCGISPLGQHDLEYGGKKHIPKLEGMSGGCFFVPTKSHTLVKFNNHDVDLDNSYIFLGIGLEFYKEPRDQGKVYGLSRMVIQKLLQEYLDENPLILKIIPRE